MAIDTALRRASVQAYTPGLMRPPPDGTVHLADRPVLAWFYAGLTYAAAAVSPIGQMLTPFISSVGTLMRR